MDVLYGFLLVAILRSLTGADYHYLRELSAVFCVSMLGAFAPPGTPQEMPYMFAVNTF